MPNKRGLLTVTLNKLMLENESVQKWLKYDVGIRTLIQGFNPSRMECWFYVENKMYYYMITGYTE